MFRGNAIFDYYSAFEKMPSILLTYMIKYVPCIIRIILHLFSKSKYMGRLGKCTFPCPRIAVKVINPIMVGRRGHFCK